MQSGVRAGGSRQSSGSVMVRVSAPGGFPPAGALRNQDESLFSALFIINARFSPEALGMTNVPHILALPERQASASARRVLSAHLEPGTAQQRRARGSHRQRELQPFASGHLQYGFAVTLLDFHRDALRPCETCFRCCSAVLSPSKQLLLLRVREPP